MHREAETFATRLIEPLRSDVLRALALIPVHRVPQVKMQSMSPWIEVDQMPGTNYAIWIATGDIYEVDAYGAVKDDPVSTRPEGGTAIIITGTEG